LRKLTILILILIFSLTKPAFANAELQYSPNDLYTIILSILGKENLPQPVSKLTFGETQANTIDNIIKSEFPISPTKVARGQIDKYRFTQAYYDKLWMVYFIGDASLAEWKDKLFEVSCSLKLENQQLQEKETNVFVKLVQLYGNDATVSKYISKNIYEGGNDPEPMFDPKLNYYIWEKNNIIITYRCFYDGKNSTVVVEYWDKNYFKQNELNGKYRVLEY